MIEGAASKLELLLEKMMVRVDHLESQLAQKDPTPVVSTIPEKMMLFGLPKKKPLNVHRLLLMMKVEVMIAPVKMKMKNASLHPLVNKCLCSLNFISMDPRYGDVMSDIE